MKRIFSLALLLLILFNTSLVSAQSPATYTATDSNTPISELTVSDDEVYVTINDESEYADSLKILFANYSNQTLSAKITPDLKSEDIEAMLEDLGISVNTTEESMDLANRSALDLIQQLQSQTSGIFPLVNPQGKLVFWINKPELIENEDELILKLYGSELLTFTVLEEGLAYEEFVLEKTE